VLDLPRCSGVWIKLPPKGSWKMMSADLLEMNELDSVFRIN
jgi:hypothetical protein